MHVHVHVHAHVHVHDMLSHTHVSHAHAHGLLRCDIEYTDVAQLGIETDGGERERERAEVAGRGQAVVDVARTSLHGSLRAPSTTSWNATELMLRVRQKIRRGCVILLQPWKFLLGILNLPSRLGAPQETDSRKSLSFFAIS